MTVLIDLIAGARPNFMKIAPIIRAMESRKSQGGALRYRLVHTGQHYDARMSGDFFEQLGIPEPDINLAAGSGTQAAQTAVREAVAPLMPADWVDLGLLLRLEVQHHNRDDDGKHPIGECCQTFWCGLLVRHGSSLWCVSFIFKV